MKRFIASAWVAGVLLFSLGVSAAGPKVVSSTVEDGQDDVDPGLTEIRATFDQAMDQNNTWSVVGGGPMFPKITARPKWADEKTIVISVQLEPEHEYWMSLNSDTFQGFRNPEGEAGAPRPLGFKTRVAGAAAEPANALTREQNQKAIEALRKAIDANYSYKDRLKLDWAKLFERERKAMEEAKTANQFARAVARILREAQDAHVFVKAGERTIGTHVNAKAPNFNGQTLRKAVTDWKEHGGGVASGKVGQGIGYLIISDWGRETGKAVDEAFAAVKDAKGLIIDVRLNGGGDEVVARGFAGRFIDGPKVYSKNRIRRDGKWDGPFDRVVEARAETDRYGGPVAVLIGPKVGSSCESFVLMMKQGSRVKLVGDVTKGSSGNPKAVELGNGVTVFLSSWEDQLPDGTVLEGRGVRPDVEVKTDLMELRQRDRVLEAGVEVVKGR